ncbi:hypothetical protein [Scleromatobacter humisilvae]|uniref:Uncharacterized protein n=1 Tax=Scleromatobacter humisilvae TaxID=2897159 RepID=A0A9X2C031_9BURK|nr:hypothetical protein [Scleromatobacter humisilvae]MCK9687303.1 hypothetical protein [Scleromatobacter humisilvae]
MSTRLWADANFGAGLAAAKGFWAGLEVFAVDAAGFGGVEAADADEVAVVGAGTAAGAGEGAGAAAVVSAGFLQQTWADATPPMATDSAATTQRTARSFAVRFIRSFSFKFIVCLL